MSETKGRPTMPDMPKCLMIHYGDTNVCGAGRMEYSSILDDVTCTACLRIAAKSGHRISEELIGQIVEFLDEQMHHDSEYYDGCKKINGKYCCTMECTYDKASELLSALESIRAAKGGA